MVDFNPSFPDLFGLEFFGTHDQKNRVWAGAPARWQRLRSTTAETITALRLSATVDPLSKASIPTVIDIVEEGEEFTQLPLVARLTPNSDNINDGWLTQADSASNLFNSVDEATTKWPNPSDTTFIKALTPTTQYACGVNAALFNSGGAAENGRIYWVAVGAILAANTGFRKLDVKLLIDGTVYDPAGGSTRDVHGFGALHEFWWGEINPATQLPWTPADIAMFDTQTDWGIRIRSSLAATATHYPTVYALSLNVQYATTENREAVAVYRRPEDIGTDRLITVTTDALRSMPAGTANWSKSTDKNYLFGWRQSVSPSEYGPVVGDDVRWNGLYQELGPAGHPPGIVYPLSTDGDAPSTTGLCSDTIAHDQYGRPQEEFDGASRAAYGIVLVNAMGSVPGHSIDSQPYRLDLADLVALRSTTGTTGQRLTPATTQTYIGVRFPIIPPTSADGTLTVRVFQVGGAQVGGNFTITADEARAITASPEGIRYVSGFFASSVALTGSTQYEIRFSTDTTSDWILFAPDCSLGPTTSFGGNTNGAVVAGSHNTNRDMCVTLIKQPDPPSAVVATVVEEDVTMADGSTRQVEHVEITWAAPSGSIAADFKRFELERQLTDTETWTRVAHLNDESLLTFTDHLVPRKFEATFRLRTVAHDGRISAWAESNAVTCDEGDYDILLTSNHAPELQVVFDVPDQTQSFTFLSPEADEIIQVHGADYQVVFRQAEDRGVGWTASIELNFGEDTPPERSGHRIVTDLLAITRSSEIPFVAAMDFQGTLILGYVRPGDAQQKEPGHLYSASIEVVPTHLTEVPVEVEP